MSLMAEELVAWLTLELELVSVCRAHVLRFHRSRSLAYAFLKALELGEVEELDHR